MWVGRATHNKIIAVARLQGPTGSDHDFNDLEYRPGQVDVGDYQNAGMDMPQGEPGLKPLKPRGLTERKKHRSSTSAAAPRPQPAYHNYSSSSTGQPSYYSSSSQPAYTHATAASYQAPVQGSPPPMQNSTFNPPSQQYQNGSFNQGYANANANQPYHDQGQQQHQQQQQQYYSQGYNQTYSQSTGYGSFQNRQNIPFLG